MSKQFVETKTVVSTLYGGTGGGPWDDGIIFNGVRAITIRSGRCIDSIHVVYDRDNKHIRAEGHGGTGGNQYPTIKLDYPREFITKVEGYFDEVDWVEGNPVVIRSLNFETNVGKKYGPYGDALGNTNPNPNATPFTFTVNPGQRIIGFFGRSGHYIDAIGFHVVDPNHVTSTR